MSLQLSGFLEELDADEQEEEYDDLSESSSEDEEEVDVHECARTGTQDDLKKVLSVERAKRIELKERKTGKIMLHWTCQLDRTEATTYLLDKKSNINAVDYEGFTPLMLAAKNGLTDMCRLLLKREANIKLRDNNCCSVLHHSVEGRFFDTSTLLVKQGADLSAEDHKGGRTALHICAEKGYTELVEMLIVRGSNLYATGDALYSMTPLHLACMNNHIECVRILVSRGADVEALSGFLDKTPLHLACENGNLECVKIMVEKSRLTPNLGRTGDRINGNNALHAAAWKGHLNIVFFLLENGAKKDQWGRFSTIGPALHIAANNGHHDIVYMLLTKFDVDIESKDIYGCTALHVACRGAFYDIALLLVQLDADIWVKALNQKTPFEYVADPVEKDKLVVASEKAEHERNIRQAVKEEEERIERERLEAIEQERLRIEKLREDERQRQIKRTEQFVHRLRAVSDVSGEMSGMVNIIEEFSDQNINSQIFPDTGCTALHRATIHGFSNIVKALLQWPGIDINIQNLTGSTALHIAATISNQDLVEQLLLCSPPPKAHLLNDQGKVAANMAVLSYLRELIRNPALISKRVKFQQAAHADALQTYVDTRNNSLSVAQSRGVVLHSDDDCFKPLHQRSSNPLPLTDVSAMIAAVPTIKTPFKGVASHTAGVLAITDGSIGTASDNNADGRDKADRKGTGGSGLNHTTETERFTQGRFGQVPVGFGGCRKDFFALSNPKSNPSSARGDSIKASFMPLISLQQRYTPSAFDSTQEFSNHRDFLFLLGHPYQDEPARDRRSALHWLSRVMDRLQLLFTAGEVQATARSSGSGGGKGGILPLIFASPNQQPHTEDASASGTPGKRVCFADVDSSNGSVEASVGSSNTSINGSALSGPFVRLRAFPPSCHYTMSRFQEERGLQHAVGSILPSLSIGDFERVVLFSYELDRLMQMVMAVLEPEGSGWPRVNGRVIGHLDKIKLMKEKDIITSLVHDSLLSLVKFGFRTVFRGVESYTFDDLSLAHCMELRIDISSEEVLTWVRLNLANTPRYLRMAIDAVFEVVTLVQKKAESSFPLDSVRAHLWADNGRAMLQKNLDNLNGINGFVEEDGGDWEREGEGRRADGPVVLHKPVHQPNPLVRTALQLWLQDMHLAEYEMYFLDKGFKTLEDFSELSEKDCVEFFPFLKLGDCRRLQKTVELLCDTTILHYESKGKGRGEDRGWGPGGRRKKEKGKRKGKGLASAIQEVVFPPLP